MKWDRTVLLDTERRIRATGVKLDTFCLRAGINRSTWTLWKSEKRSVTPRPETLAKVERTLHKLEARRLARAA
jgi:hypothetical protein